MYDLALSATLQAARSAAPEAGIPAAVLQNRTGYRIASL